MNIQGFDGAENLQILQLSHNNISRISEYIHQNCLFVLFYVFIANTKEREADHWSVGATVCATEFAFNVKCCHCPVEGIIVPG